MKGKFMDDASFAHVAATNKNKVIVKQKIEAASLSSSSSNEETSEEHKVFTCSSCSRKFSNQHAMAGHRNIHRSEWESILQDISEEGKKQSIKLPCNLQSFHFHNATIPLKQQSPGNTHSTLSNNTSSRIHKTLPCPPPYLSANAKNLLQEPPVRAPTHSLVNPTSSLKHPSACVPCYPLVNSTKTLKGPVPRYPLANHINILKRQSPSWPLANPTNSLGRLAACAPRCPLIDPVNTLEGPSSKHPMVNPTKNLNEQSPRAEHAPSPSQEGGGSSEARDFFSSSLQSTGGRGIKAHNLFAPTPAKERQNTDHSSEGPTTPRNNNGENESSLDIDLELKL
ncbi:hypothetical protein L1887_29241 [Cichorium endivia]|nr:hypothetical protein L1887_29241 [Cichorium endivia]